jgi:hypothetical protein
VEEPKYQSVFLFFFVFVFVFVLISFGWVSNIDTYSHAGSSTEICGGTQFVHLIEVFKPVASHPGIGSFKNYKFRV